MEIDGGKSSSRVETDGEESSPRVEADNGESSPRVETDGGEIPRVESDGGQGSSHVPIHFDRQQSILEFLLERDGVHVCYMYSNFHGVIVWRS